MTAHLRLAWAARIASTSGRRELWEMTEAEFASKRWVFHATSYLDDLNVLLTQGVRMENVPNNLARQRFERGEYAEFAPGAGVGRGLYVGGTAYDVGGYGAHVVAIQVNLDELAVPPESTVPERTVERALKDHNGAVIVKDIPPSRVYLVEKYHKYMIYDPLKAAREYAAREGLI